MRIQQNYSGIININLYSILAHSNDDQNRLNKENENSKDEEEYEDDSSNGWSEMSWERGGEESDEDYNERMEDLNNFLDNF